MSNGGDFGEYELDDAERRAAEVNLDDPSAGDDEVWTPPERRPRGGEFLDSNEHESLSVRIREEEHEIGTAYGDPDDADTRPERAVGGDDPDAISDDDDFVGDVDDETRDPDEDGYAEFRKYDDESGPEASAMHVVQE